MEIERSIESSNDLITPNPTGEEALIERSSDSIRRKIIGGAIVGLATAALFVEQSPLNESVRIPPAAAVFRSTGSELKTGGVVGALTLGIEIPTSILVSAGLNYERDRIRKVVNRFKGADTGYSKKDETPKDYGLRDIVTDTSIAFGLGPSVLVAKRHIQNPERTFKSNVKTGVKASVAVSALAASIGGISAVLLKQADNLGAFKKPAEYFVDYATDWKFWIGVVGSIQVLSYARNKLRGKRRRMSSKDEILAERDNRE